MARINTDGVLGPFKRICVSNTWAAIFIFLLRLLNKLENVALLIHLARIITTVFHLITKQHWLVKAYLIPFLGVTAIYSMIAVPSVLFYQQLMLFYVYVVGITGFIFELFRMQGVGPELFLVLKAAFVLGSFCGLIGVLMACVFRGLKSTPR